MDERSDYNTENQSSSMKPEKRTSHPIVSLRSIPSYTGIRDNHQILRQHVEQSLDYFLWLISTADAAGVVSYLAFTEKEPKTT
jgi:hypothetical protein